LCTAQAQQGKLVAFYNAAGAIVENGVDVTVGLLTLHILQHKASVRRITLL